MARKPTHVVPSSGRWAVRRAGTDRASSVHDTQERAIAAGKKIAKTEGTELVIHGRDGRIREKNSYGNDPFPPRG